MHETDMTKALIMTVRDWYVSQPDPPTIEAIHLVVGQFTCVEPAGLAFAFKAQTHKTFLEGVPLVIRETPLIAFCGPCDRPYHPQIGLQYTCPTCGGAMEDIRSGRELKIERIEYSLEGAKV